MNLVLSITYLNNLDRDAHIIDAVKFTPNTSLTINKVKLQAQTIKEPNKITFLVDMSKNVCIGKIFYETRKLASNELSKI